MVPDVLRRPPLVTALFPGAFAEPTIVHSCTRLIRMETQKLSRGGMILALQLCAVGCLRHAGVPYRILTRPRFTLMAITIRTGTNDGARGKLADEFNETRPSVG